MNTTSGTLLERLRNRQDHDAWSKWYAIYEPLLRGWFGRRLSPTDVEDLLQEVFVVVSQKLPDFVHNGQRGAFRKWLKNVLVNKGGDFLKRRRRIMEPSTDWEQLEDPTSKPSQAWDEEHDRHVMRHLLSSVRAEFSTRDWAVFEALTLEDPRPTGAAVADRHTMTVDAVYAVKSRILASLRQARRESGLYDQF